MPEDFQLVAGHLALDFANTLDNRYDPERRLELLPTHDRLLAFAHQTGILTAAQQSRLAKHASRKVLARAVELREAIHFIFQAVAAGQPAPDEQLRILNRALVKTRVPRVIAREKSDYVWKSRDIAESPSGLLWPIAEAAAELLLSPDRFHVRECTANTCRWLFLDRSKNHTRRWCDMKLCGNRAKAQRFQSRQRD